ncbi:MAG: hypothetical protein HQK50_00495 [Oligoflexia bacterium]|nr:hypothetical protein [Oligoflexia bacterium]MBF0364014.1 hypothetical protein [Oligoflexia bacterium]
MNATKLFYGIALPLVLIAIGVSCGLTPNHQTGVNSFTAGNYEDAKNYLQAAKQEGQDDEELLLMLSDSKFKVAESEYQKAQAAISSSGNDLTTILAHLTRAKEEAEGSLAELEQLSKDSKAAEAQQLDPKRELLEKIKLAWEEKSKKRQEIVSTAHQLQAMANTKKNVEKTYVEFTATTAPYKEYVPEVQESYLFIEQALINELEKNGFTALDSSQLNDARKIFEKLQNYFPSGNGNLKAQEGLLCLKSQELYQKKDYRGSYEALLAAKRVNTNSPYVAQYAPKRLQEVIKHETQQALRRSKNKEKSVLSLFSSLDSYHFLLSLEGVSEEQKNTFTKEITTLRREVATTLVDRAKKMQQTAPPLVWALLQLAWRFDPSVAEKQQPLMSEAIDWIKAKRELKLLVFVKSRPELAQLPGYNSESKVKQQLIPPLPFPSDWPIPLTIKLAGEVLPAEYLATVNTTQDLATRAPAAIKQKLSESDALMWITILESKVEEYGQNQPNYKNSTYISGTRTVDNPEWFTAQQEYNSAQQEYNNNYQYTQQLASRCNSMSNAFAATLCNSSINAISSSRLDNARARFNSTPRYIQENISSEYSYRYYKVGVNVSMKAEVKYLDSKNQRSLEPKIIEYNIANKEGEILEGVQPSDLQGLKNGRNNVPDPQVEKTAAQNQLISDLQAEIKAIVAKENGLRFCLHATKNSHTSKKIANAPYLSNLQLCLLFSKNAQAAQEIEKLKEAQKELEHFLQVTPDDLQKYALHDNNSSIWTLDP